MDDNVNNVDNNVDNPAAGDQGAPEVNYEKLYQEASKSILDLTAERDSLLSENRELRDSRDAALADNAKTKEVNYTLSRQLNLQQEIRREPENILADMFLKKGD